MLLDPTAVIITSDSRRSIPSVLGLTLEPRKSYMFLTNSQYTCVYRGIPGGSLPTYATRSPTPLKTELPKPKRWSCFPASATVQLEAGHVVPMHRLTVGDRVHVGSDMFSPVYMFSHAVRGPTYDFVSLSTASGRTLLLTSGHYLYVNGALVAAHTVLPGDALLGADGFADDVIRVNHVRKTGLYNPQTLHGDIAVDGVVASTFTTAVDRRFALGMLAPLRAAYSALGLVLRGFLDDGFDSVAHYLPKGLAVQ
eukprot:IDg19524t1